MIVHFVHTGPGVRVDSAESVEDMQLDVLFGDLEAKGKGDRPNTDRDEETGSRDLARP